MIFISFLSGSLPFSVWLTRIFLGKNVRDYGDGNPGAANVFKAGNNFVGLLVLILDISKAALPVGFSYFNLQIRGFPMFMIATAPILGHMFSPFLAFKGGKAIAATLGVWIGLTIWKTTVPAVITVIICIIFLNSSGWSVIFAMIAILFTLILWSPTALFFLIWLATTFLLAWTHRKELKQPPLFRNWVSKYLKR